MKKLMSRWLVLVTLLVCLGVVSAVDSRTIARDPYCPENCHAHCRKEYNQCSEVCEFDPDCIRERCKPDFVACMDYCDWVCGPE